MIEVKNLVKRYGGRCAVDHLSFTVEDGQIFGFLGPNGAGKSTTMNIITGYLAASEGEVVIDGHDILAEPEEARRCIGYLPEQPPLYDEMTVEEYLDFCGELKGLCREERAEQVERVLAMTHLEDQACRLIGNLSKGYRQRVGLAQAVLGFPKLILLDEPTVGLDPQQVVEIRGLIRRLGRNHTVLLSSHILSEIRAVCDHVLILRKGRLVACDTPEALERRLGGQGAAELVVRGTAAQAAAVLDGVPGLAGWQATEADGETVRLTVESGEDAREALFFAFAKAGLPLLELRRRSATLEQVFLDLTDSDDERAAQAAALLTDGETGREDGADEDEDAEDGAAAVKDEDAGDEAAAENAGAKVQATEDGAAADEDAGGEGAEVAGKEGMGHGGDL